MSQHGTKTALTPGGDDREAMLDFGTLCCRVSETHAATKRIEHFIDGNGKKGMRDMVTILWEDRESLKAERRAHLKRGAKVATLATGIGAAIGTAIYTVLWLVHNIGTIGAVSH